MSRPYCPEPGRATYFSFTMIFPLLMAPFGRHISFVAIAYVPTGKANLTEY